MVFSYIFVYVNKCVYFSRFSYGRIQQDLPSKLLGSISVLSVFLNQNGREPLDQNRENMD